MEHASPATLFFLFIFVGPVVFSIYRAHYRSKPFIRRIAGIDAIDDAIGRTVELGRPIAFTSGLESISPLLYASLGALRYIAEKSAVFGSRIYVPCFDPEAMVVSDATVQSAFRNKHRFSKYDATSVRFLSNAQFAYASGYMGLVHRENVGAAFLFGSFAAESLILAEAGQHVGALQVAATTSNEQIPFFITSCDYTLIGEEIYAAGAYLSGDAVQTGSLRGQDIAKAIIFLLIIIGIITNTVLPFMSEPMVDAQTSFIDDFIAMSWDDLFAWFGNIYRTVF